MSTTPTLPSDPQSMPLNDLKAAAGLTQPSVTTEPTIAAPSPAAPPVVPEQFIVTQDDNGVTVQMAPEYGGEIFKGKDWNEVGPKIAKAKAEANSYIKQLKNQPPPQPQAPEPPQPQESPDEVATREWILTQTAKAHGMTLEQYKAFVNQTFKTVEQMSVQTAFAEFSSACPGYIDTPENANILASYFPNNLDHFPSAQELRQAYALALLDGKMQAAQPAQPVTPKQPVPMPSVSASASQASGQSEWAMPLEQLRQAAGIK